MFLSDGPTHLRDDGVSVWAMASVGMAVEQNCANLQRKMCKA